MLNKKRVTGGVYCEGCYIKFENMLNHTMLLGIHTWVEKHKAPRTNDTSDIQGSAGSDLWSAGK